MLKDLFSNRLFLGAFAFFVLIVVSGTLYLQHVERQTAEKLAEVQARVKAFNERQGAASAEASESGHFHADGTWHAGAHDSKRNPGVENPSRSSQPPLTFSGERPLTKAEVAEWQKYWADMGLEPPPSGHGYQWDENGKVSLFQYNVPEFEVKWSEKETPGQDYYKLTDEEWRCHRGLTAYYFSNPTRTDTRTNETGCLGGQTVSDSLLRPWCC